MKQKNPSLKIISNCPVCKSVYYPSEINVLDETENAHLLHLECRKCKSRLLVLLIAGPKGINSIGLLTDLDGGEALKFLKSDAIDADEVLEAKYFLKRPGSLVKILKKTS